MGASILKLKKNIVPHIFDCQVDRRQASTSNSRPLHSKRIRQNIIKTAVQNQSCMTEGTYTFFKIIIFCVFIFIFNDT